MASRSRRGGSGAPRKRPARPHNAAETQAETTLAPETAEEVVAREMEEIRKEVRHLPGIYDVFGVFFDLFGGKWCYWN